MNQRYRLWLMLALVAAIGGAAWLAWEWRRSMTRPSGGSAGVIVFHDRSDADFEYAYIIRADAVIAQRSVFPGYLDRVWFSCPADGETKTLVEGLDARILAAKARTGPFAPGGVWFSAARYSDDGTVLLSEHFFQDDDPEITRLASDLRGLLPLAKQIEKLPEAVRSLPGPRKDLGLPE